MTLEPKVNGNNFPRRFHDLLFKSVKIQSYGIKESNLYQLDDKKHNNP